MNGFSASHKSKNANFVGEDIILPPLGQMILFEEREGKPLPYGVKQYAVRRRDFCSYRLFDNGRIISSPTIIDRRALHRIYAHLKAVEQNKKRKLLLPFFKTLTLIRLDFVSIMRDTAYF